MEVEIRLETAQELAMTRRLFSIFGMQPVGYYDLTVAGLSVHTSGFRPVAERSLHYNPFRVFTSLLRLDPSKTRPPSQAAGCPPPVSYILSAVRLVNFAARKKPMVNIAIIVLAFVIVRSRAPGSPLRIIY